MSKANRKKGSILWQTAYGIEMGLSNAKIRSGQWSVRIGGDFCPRLLNLAVRHAEILNCPEVAESRRQDQFHGAPLKPNL